MAGFDWIGFRNETEARQVELATVLGTTQGTISKRISSMKIESNELEALRAHFGSDVVDKYIGYKGPETGHEVIMVPVINLDARGGFAANDELGTEYATDLMPFSKRIAQTGDIVIPVYGDSMTPKFPSGCMVLIRKVERWREYIELGATYVMELVDGRRLIKNIKKSDNKDCFLLESINPEYQPTDIPKKMINLIFRVIMSIQRESL